MELCLNNLLIRPSATDLAFVHIQNLSTDMCLREAVINWRGKLSQGLLFISGYACICRFDTASQHDTHLIWNSKWVSTVISTFMTRGTSAELLCRDLLHTFVSKEILSHHCSTRKGTLFSSLSTEHMQLTCIAFLRMISWY
jgi:hypothetical protein